MGIKYLYGSITINVTKRNDTKKKNKIHVDNKVMAFRSAITNKAQRNTKNGS